MQAPVDNTSAMGKLRKALNADDLRYLQSHNTKPFRLFRADTLARLSKQPAGSDVITAAVRRSAVAEAKTMWSAMDIATKLYYCKRANCFHSRSKLRLINRCSFPQEEEEAGVIGHRSGGGRVLQQLNQTATPLSTPAPIGRIPTGNSKSSSNNNFFGSFHGHGANFQMRMDISGHLAYQWQGPEPYYDANGQHFKFFAAPACGPRWN